MAQTRFSGPVVSDNGFVGSVTGNVSATLVTGVTVTASGTLVVGTTTVTTGAVSGTIADQLGYIPVKIGSTTKYIALYSSLTP